MSNTNIFITVLGVITLLLVGVFILNERQVRLNEPTQQPGVYESKGEQPPYWDVDVPAARDK